MAQVYINYRFGYNNNCPLTGGIDLQFTSASNALIRPRAMWKRRLWQLAVYTLLFASLFFLATLVLYLNGKSFVEKTDGAVLRFPATEYGRQFWSNLLHGNLRQWDWTVGYGANPLMELSGLSEVNDPFYLFALPVSQVTETVFAFLIFLRLYCAGLAFLLLSKLRGNSFLPSLAGCIVYCFTAYTLTYCLKHPCFILPMIWLPLIFSGIEQALRRKSPFWLTAGVALSAFSSVYFLFMIVIFTVLYALIRYFYVFQKGERLQNIPRTLLRVILWSLLGFGIAAVLLVPSIMALLYSPRTSAFSFSFSLQDLLRDGFSESVQLFAQGWSSLNMVLLALPLAALVLVRRKKYGDYKWLCGILLVIAAVSAVRSLLNGISFPTYRWVFFAALVFGLMTATALTRLHSITARDCAVMFGALGVFTLAVLISLLFGPYRQNLSVAVLVGVFALALALLLIRLIGRLRKRQHPLLRAVYSRRIPIVFTAALYCCAAVNGFVTYTGKLEGHKSDFMNSGTADAYYGEETQRLFQNLGDDGFYRVDTQKYAGTTSNSQGRDNSGIALGYRGITSAKSLVSGDLFDFYLSNELRCAINGCEFAGLDERAALSTLTGVKYYLAYKDVKAPVPYGFEPYKTEGDYTIYRNKYDLGIAYAYDTYQLETDLAALDAPQRQIAMLQSVTLAQKPANDTAYRPVQPSGVKALDYRVIQSSGVEISANRMTSDRKNGSVTLNVSGVKGKELYVFLESAVCEPSGTALTMYLQMDCGTVSKKHRYAAEGYDYYIENQPNLYHLGYQDTDDAQIKITMAGKGAFSFERFRVVAVDMAEYDAAAQQLSQNKLQNVQVSGTTVQGNITREREGILFTSIPHTVGWSASVNGKPVEILRANTGFCAVPLKAGENAVQFTYRSPYLIPSLAVSTLCTAAFLALIICTLLRRRRTAQQTS